QPSVIKAKYLGRGGVARHPTGILGVRDREPELLDRVRHGIEPKVALQAPQDGSLVVLVDENEMTQPELRAEPSQESKTKSVEGAEPDALVADHLVADELGHPAPHLVGGLIGEGEGDDAIG